MKFHTLIKTLIIGLILTTTVAGCSVNTSRGNAPSPQPSPVPKEGAQNPEASEPVFTACTMEAKICPDGSTVGRSGPNCEFTACPPSSSTAPGVDPILLPSDN